jgi:hypothetical protein
LLAAEIAEGLKAEALAKELIKEEGGSDSEGEIDNRVRVSWGPRRGGGSEGNSCWLCSTASERCV